MKSAALALILLSTACQDYNANTFDRARYGKIELTGGNEFKASYPVLQKRCMNCHRHAQWAGYTDEQDWVNNENLVIFGDVNGSQLIYRIINHGGASSDMPQGGKPLPAAEYETLRGWVESP